MQRWLVAPTLAAMCFAALPERAAAAQFAGPNPIALAGCNPQPAGAAAGPSFVPGYFPSGTSYVWRDIYKHRYYQPPLRSSNPTLAIEFVNESPMAIAQIEFGLLANRALVAEVRDVGIFAPGVKAKRIYGLSPNVFPFEGRLRCIALHVKWKNGSVWMNPNLPPLPKFRGIVQPLSR